MLGEKLVFTFPGQGSFDLRLLLHLYEFRKSLRKLFHVVDEVAGDILGVPFLPMVLGGGQKQEQLTQFPDLDQLGIYLANYATAQLWFQHGIIPGLLMGHSFGELAAFAVAGIYGFEDGAKIVCQRVLSLREAAVPGRMAAVAAPRARVETALKKFVKECSIAVVNHPGQTVVSGPEQELVELRNHLAREAVAVTFLQSRYAFHSALLSDASRAFAISLRGYRFESPNYPVVVGTEKQLLDAEMDLANVMALQLVKPLDFESNVQRLVAEGYGRFLECGAGATVTKIVNRVLKGEKEHRAWSTFPAADGIHEHLGRVAMELSTAKLSTRTSESIPLQTVNPATSAEPVRMHTESCPLEPVAIVGMGCVFPGGANGPDKFWENMTAGISGIVDLAAIDPSAGHDFLAGKVQGSVQEIVSDKTYTLLYGSVTEVSYDGKRLDGRYSEHEFGLLTKGQKILALAMAQARLPRTSEVKDSRLQCILGSTADGSAELDEAHFAASVREVVNQLDTPLREKEAFSQCFDNALPGWTWNPSHLTPHKLYASVANKILGVSPDCSYLVDAACSSSLYSIALGVRALRAGEADLAYAGGVFAPGPANNNLFAQFRGLTPNESRPFDAKADGVVFGDGAGILALKRLRDAIDDGDTIMGVIRSDGFSSDGKSPSINVPQSNGQVMAIQCAYERAALDPKSVQYIEAHATATPVGDAVEFKALRESLPPPDGSCRFLGSVKALIGHTGWTSGVASVIKICKAMEHRRIPKQFGYDSPNPNIELDGSGFTIPAEEIDWPENTGGLPRRAGLNGFGFGGTNAHFIVEEYLEPYHRALAGLFRGRPSSPVEVVVVAADGIFPEDGRSFMRKQLRMPKKRLVLPDVAEHMDASQYLATMAAEKIIDSFPPEFFKSRLRIGVALGLTSKTERGVRANERVFLDRLSRIARAAGASEETLGRVRQAITANVIPSGPYTLPGLMPNVAASRVTHTFNWHGPNIVIDRGTGSLVQTLDAGIKFVRAGDCEVVLAGGVNAWLGHDHSAREGVAFVALATADVAKKYGLPILASLQFSNSLTDAAQVALDTVDTSYCGATGAVELLEAVRQVSRNSTSVQLTWNGASLMTLVHAGGRQSRTQPQETKRPIETRSSHAYVQDTPITNYTPVLVDAPVLESTGSAHARSYLFLADQPEAWHEFERETSLHDLSYTVVTPSSVKIPGAQSIDVSTEDSPREGLAQLQHLSFDTIVAVKQLSGFYDEDLLLRDFRGGRSLLDLLFCVCRLRYDDIAGKRCSVATICLGSLRDGEFDGFTGLFGGFMKSIARELPEAACKAIVTDETQLLPALSKAVTELAANDRITEVAYRQGRRLCNALIESPLHSEGTPWIGKDSVVLATGGGRGVTAVLAQYLMEAHGCTVIALGRTDPECLPENLRTLDEAALQEYEPQFYREQLAADRSKKILELKKLFERYLAAHELVSVIRQCKTLAAKYEYVKCDINDASSIDRVVEDTLARYGRLDMVLHGAGVQVSKTLPRKGLTDFQRVVSTKVGSLGHLYQACHKRGLHKRVHFHILTSAFSYLGNDGQPDYGAANEAMNRMAGRMNLKHAGCYWSTLAWLGWAGIGMTRGTEYAALAASRRLRGVTREEGQRIFADAITGRPTSPVNVLLADGEKAFYRPAIRKQVGPMARTLAIPPTAETIVEWPVSLEAMPFLSDHTVRGLPTLPGSFLIAMAADAAHKLVPDLKIIQFERTRFLRLVRAYEGRPGHVRAVSRLVQRDGGGTLVLVRIVMDFIHKSGRVLGKDLLHTEIYVRMSSTVPKSSGSNGHADHLPGVCLPDPYVMESSPVRLNGAFRTMKEVVVGQTTRRAEYKLSGNTRYDSSVDYLMPNVILVDAFWRFGTVRASERGLSVYVPEKCDAMKVFFDYADFNADLFRGPVTFHGMNPRAQGEVLHVGPIDAFDAKGQMLLRVEGGVCRRFGEIEVS